MKLSKYIEKNVPSGMGLTQQDYDIIAGVVKSFFKRKPRSVCFKQLRKNRLTL